MLKAKKFKSSNLNEYDQDYDNEDFTDLTMSRAKSKNRKGFIHDFKDTATHLSERTRLVSINEAFEILRTHIPTFPYERRLSKIDTLHLAIAYINLLESVLESNLGFYGYFEFVLNQTFSKSSFNNYQFKKPIWATSGICLEHSSLENKTKFFLLKI